MIYPNPKKKNRDSERWRGTERYFWSQGGKARNRSKSGTLDAGGREKAFFCKNVNTRGLNQTPRSMEKENERSKDLHKQFRTKTLDEIWIRCSSKRKSPLSSIGANRWRAGEKRQGGGRLMQWQVWTIKKMRMGEVKFIAVLGIGEKPTKNSMRSGHRGNSIYKSKDSEAGMGG